MLANVDKIKRNHSISVTYALIINDTYETKIVYSVFFLNYYFPKQLE